MSQFYRRKFTQPDGFQANWKCYPILSAAYYSQEHDENGNSILDDGEPVFDESPISCTPAEIEDWDCFLHVRVPDTLVNDKSEICETREVPFQISLPLPRELDIH